ncbi:MAG: urease accessory protein UreE [Pseudomonadota bacterium]
MRVETILSPPFAAADFIILDETERHRRRHRMVSHGGVEFVLDLPEARLINDGEGLKLEDGTIIEVRAAAEKLYIVRAANKLELVKLAWQLGNRHLPVQILDQAIIIRRDHVIKDMLIGLGASVEDIDAPFHPEVGAYHHSHGHHD